MSILAKLFGGVTTQQPVANQQNLSPAQQANPNINTPAQPGNLPAQNNNPADVNNPTVPASSVVAANTQAPEGLDKFTDMWNIKPEDMPKGPESAFAGVTPEAIRTVAGKTDFSKVVTPEMMSAISAGGEGAVAATLQAMNVMAQENYAQSAEASMKLIETALEKQRNEFTAQLPNLIKQQTVAESLRNTNPIFNHAAAAPMLQMLQQQMQLKNPTATADQIKQKAEEFLVSFASAATPVKANNATNKGNKPAEPDWNDWM